MNKARKVLDMLEKSGGIEAYGVKGLNSKPWRKTFKSQEEYEKWLDANKGNVEVHGTRDIAEATKNKKWGFYGTLRDNFKLEASLVGKLFDSAADKIAQLPGATRKLADEYLDSVYGRHLADNMSFFGAKKGSDIGEIEKALDKALEEVGFKGYHRFIAAGKKKYYGA